MKDDFAAIDRLIRIAAWLLGIAVALLLFACVSAIVLYLNR